MHSALAQKSMIKTVNENSVLEDELRIRDNEAGNGSELEDNISEFDEGEAPENEELNTAVNYGKKGHGKPVGGLNL